MSTLLFLATGAAPSPGMAAASLNLMVAWVRLSPLLGSSRCLLARVHAFWTEQRHRSGGAQAKYGQSLRRGNVDREALLSGGVALGGICLICTLSDVK